MRPKEGKLPGPKVLLHNRVSSQKRVKKRLGVFPRKRNLLVFHLRAGGKNKAKKIFESAHSPGEGGKGNELALIVLCRRTGKED